MSSSVTKKQHLRHNSPWPRLVLLIWWGLLGWLSILGGTTQDTSIYQVGLVVAEIAPTADPSASSSPSHSWWFGTSASTASFDEDPSLYTELRDMSAVSFLVYIFAYMTDVARTVGLEGLELDDYDNETNSSATRRLHKTPTSTLSRWLHRELPRSFTPQEVRDLIETNQEVLAKYYPSMFGINSYQYQLTMQNLRTLQDRADSYVHNYKRRPLTLEEMDDRHQSHEMVYALSKDDVHQRITLVFRGTENELALKSNWLTNLNMAKVKTTLPPFLQETQEEHGLSDHFSIHKGFYNYVFSLTKDDMDDSTFRKFDEILQDVRALLHSNPGYALYVTGHSLGAALSTLVSFYLSCEEDIPKPVTCINFASPRLGDFHFMKAVQYMEETQQLRMVRVVNENDSVAFFPVLGYCHVGFQVRLERNVAKTPKISYPTKGGSIDLAHLWQNSFLRSLNPGYDHGDYRERVDKHQGFLKTLDLDALYANATLTGFSDEE